MLFRSHSWNPVWGCSFACPYCYAKGIAKRFGNQIAGRDDFLPTFIEKNFRKGMPKAPARVFVNSMSDVADWKTEWIDRVFAKIKENPGIDFLFLTKRPEVYGRHDFPMNAWLGLSWTGECACNFPYLGTEGRIRFLSIEPLLANPMPCSIVDWVVIGAESGNRAGKITPKKEWIERIEKACNSQAVQVPVFMKDSLVPIMGDFMRREFPNRLF